MVWFRICLNSSRPITVSRMQLWCGRTLAGSGRGLQLGNRYKRSGFGLLVRMITGAHQRAGLHMTEAAIKCFTLQILKFAGSVKARDRKMIARRPQVLSNRQDIHSTPAE